MDHKKKSEDSPELKLLLEQLLGLYGKLGGQFQHQFNRLLPFSEMIVNRWDKAKMINAGAETNIYDSSVLIGDVQIGKKCWIGPYTILDASGGLSIGDYCTISAGVHIYSHDNVRQTLSSKALPIVREPVSIGDNVYIAPHSIITKGVTIGNRVVIGAFSFVNRSVPDNSIVMGQPAKIVGQVEINGEEINFKYE